MRGSEVRATLMETLKETSREGEGVEKLVEIVYQPQAKFRVESVTHCTSSIPGRGERRKGGSEGGKEGKREREEGGRGGKEEGREGRRDVKEVNTGIYMQRRNSEKKE